MTQRKLTEDQVRDIRHYCWSQWKSKQSVDYVMLQRNYGASRGMVSHLLARRCYAEVVDHTADIPHVINKETSK